jgi:hypothetical protein
VTFEIFCAIFSGDPPETEFSQKAAEITKVREVPVWALTAPLSGHVYYG